MKNRLVIIGAGGHGKVIADIAVKNGYRNICFVDDSVAGACMGIPIVGTTEKIKSLNDGGTDFIIAIGNNESRKAFAEKFSVNWISLIHPSAQIAMNVTIGNGTVIMANAVVNVGSAVGKHCIINTGAIVEHDNVIEDYVHIAPRVTLGGTVRVGKLTHVGIATTVNNNLEICENTMIGAGTVVVSNVEQCGTYIGVPARKLK